jgi:hypothetical protein
MEDRTVNALGGGVLRIGCGMHVDPIVFLDRIFSDGSGSPNRWVELANGARLWPYSIGLDLAAARAARDALSDAIEEAELREDQPAPELRAVA